MKTDDDTDIVSFSREQLAILDDYFRGTNAETAYLLGRYCGLRINEAFGLKWENVDLEKWIEQEDEETGEKKEIPFLRYYNVFHIDQSGVCGGVDEPYRTGAGVRAIKTNGV